jgi:glycosyltransferase involved in cell wall biosynthesis
MRSRQRLVFIHPSDELYGADRILLDIWAALDADDRAHAEFWLPTDVPHGESPLCAELERRGARVRHLPLPILRRAYRRPGQLLALGARLVRTQRHLWAARPALVYLTTSATYLSAPAARLAGVPSVIGHKQEMWSGADARILAACARACRQLIAISRPVYENLPPALRSRATVVLNATPDPGPHSPVSMHTGQLTYVVASRWNAWKGHRTLLAAWDRLDRPGRLVVLGGRPAIGDSVDVPALVARLRHPDSVTIVGEVDDIGPHIDAGDVVVMPSDDPEPFGLVAIEAFARGRPVIGSDAGGLADTITHGSDGWTFPPGDVDALAAIVAGLDRDRVAAAGRHARAAYEARFTLERFVADWRRAVRRDVT